MVFPGGIDVFASTLVAVCVLLGQADVAPAPDSPAADSPAAEAAKADPGPTVRKLIRQLNDDELARREEAEKRLIEFGPEILGLLPPPTLRTPPEVRQRLHRVRLALEQADAENATRASTVTLEGAMPWDAVLAAIEQQTGNKLSDYRDRFGQEKTNVNVKLAIRDKPFWPALDEVLDAADMTVYGYSGQKHTLAVVQRSDDDLPRVGRAAYDGVFRIEATRVEASRNLRNPAQDALKLTLEVVWEPRLLPISIQLPLDKLTVTDDRNRPLGASREGGNLEVAVQSTVSTVQLDVPMPLPARDARKIASLKGQLLARIPGRVETYQFDKLSEANDVEQRKAGVTVVLQQARKNRDVFEVRILVRFTTAAGALESHRGWILSNEAYLLDPAGERINFATLEETRRTENEAGMAYIFPVESLEGHQFVYKTPAAIVQLPARFELKDIELP